MSATNHTTNLSLSQFVNTDVPAWRQDYNGDMLKIDNAYTADISSATAETSADPSDYMKFYDVSATTNKKILISDLLKGAKVEDLTDTDITTPIEDDALVYDATAQKWENVPIMTKEQWKKNGAYNLARGVFTSKVENGTTYIANSDGSVSVSGEATGSNITSSDFTLKAGTYLVGFNPIPMSGGVSTDATNFTILDSSNNHLTGLPLNDATSKVITVAADTVVKIRLYVYANSSGHTTNTTFYPVITTDLNATVADFVSPAKTNRELTEDIKESSTTVSLSLLGNSSTKTIYKWGKVCEFLFQMGGSSFSGATGYDQVGTIPDGYRPKQLTTLPVSGRSTGAWASATQYHATVAIDTNGKIYLMGKASDIQSCLYFEGTLSYLTN